MRAFSVFFFPRFERRARAGQMLFGHQRHDSPRRPGGRGTMALLALSLVLVAVVPMASQAHIIILLDDVAYNSTNTTTGSGSGSGQGMGDSETHVRHGDIFYLSAPYNLTGESRSCLVFSFAQSPISPLFVEHKQEGPTSTTLPPTATSRVRFAALCLSLSLSLSLSLLYLQLNKHKQHSQPTLQHLPQHCLD